MRALFMRGAFTAADAQAAAATLAAYAIGLLPFVLMRSVTVDVPRARRHRDAGQGAALSAVAVNVALKIAAVWTRYAQVGLALRDLDRRLDQFRPADLVRGARAACIGFDDRLKRAVVKLARRRPGARASRC